MEIAGHRETPLEGPRDLRHETRPSLATTSNYRKTGPSSRRLADRPIRRQATQPACGPKSSGTDGMAMIERQFDDPGVQGDGVELDFGARQLTPALGETGGTNRSPSPMIGMRGGLEGPGAAAEPVRGLAAFGSQGSFSSSPAASTDSNRYHHHHHQQQQSAGQGGGVGHGGGSRLSPPRHQQVTMMHPQAGGGGAEAGAGGGESYYQQQAAGQRGASAGETDQYTSSRDRGGGGGAQRSSARSNSPYRGGGGANRGTGASSPGERRTGRRGKLAACTGTLPEK